jgi:hypothetical protein
MHVPGLYTLADPTATIVIGLVVIAAVMLFGVFIGRIAALLLPIVESLAYTILLALLFLLWMINPFPGLGFPRTGFLALFAGLFVFRLVLELAAPHRSRHRREHESGPESQFDWGLHHPGSHHDGWSDGGGSDSHGGGDGGAP